jgi:hypothetical protein
VVVMRTGPVEYMVLGFPDGGMSEEVGDELLWLSITHVIRILDFALVTKDDGARISIVQLNELTQMGGFADLGENGGKLIGQHDIEFVSTGLNAGSSAALVIFEDLWATSLSEALHRSGALLLERVTHARGLSYTRTRDADSADGGGEWEEGQAQTPSIPLRNQIEEQCTHRPSR